jgi:hypothetical protein
MKDQIRIRRGAIITLIISSALFVLLLLLPFLLFREQKDSVGIIGGSDGPTAIFVTGQIWRQFGSVMPLFLGAVVLCSLFCAVFPRTVWSPVPGKQVLFHWGFPPHFVLESIVPYPLFPAWLLAVLKRISSVFRSALWAA